MRLLSIFERDDGSVWKLVAVDGDAIFSIVKPWSLEWIQFKIRKWRFFL